MKKPNYSILFTTGVLTAGLLFFSLAVQAAFNFNDGGFATTWNRVDKPVQDNANPGRGYTWGPVVSGSESQTGELYNGATRKVQYFDKARMEVNNPATNPADLYYVTTGLLVKEMVSGQRQDGDSLYTPLVPSSVQVAGDSNETGQTNGIAPVYASFKNTGTFAAQTSPAAPNGLINSRIDKAGAVSSFEPPEIQLLGTYDPVTDHNIAQVFDKFSNASGPVWNGSAIVNGPVFFNNPVYVLGRPLTEPYWSRAVVAGQERAVLVQLFERRVLTYTPSNPDPYKVEMGNVGQHYYRWRYQINAPVPPTATPPPVAPTPTPPPPAHPVPVASTAITSTTFGGKGTLQDQNFISPILKLEVPYQIYLPPGYAHSFQRYPVLYALHGYGGNYHEWNEYGLIGRADDLIGAGTIQPMIIVLPYGAQSYWLNHADNGPRWGDYTVYDVVNFIDANYRTLADRNHRAIGGLSMGGHGALQNGFNHPEVFGIIGGHSPTLRTLDQNPGYFGDAAYFATIDPESLARTKDLSSLKIWLDIGQDDGAWIFRMRDLHQVMLDRQIAHIWQNWPGEHSGVYWASHTVDYLKYYSDNFAR